MLKDYNLKHCIMLVDGLPVGGFSDGDACTIEFQSDVWTETVGSDGEVTRSATNDQRAAITFNLQDTSSLNAFFRQKVLAARTAGKGDVFSFMLKDLNLGEKVVSPETWIKTDPGVSKGRESSTREWACMGANVIITQG